VRYPRVIYLGGAPMLGKTEVWDSPLVIEGYALRPSYVHSLTGDISGVFLLADAALIEKRVRSSDFSNPADTCASSPPVTVP
jgi:hypothetical protein